MGPENWQALLDGAYAFRYARAEAEAESKSASTSKEQTREQTGQREEEKPARFMLVRASTAGDALAVFQGYCLPAQLVVGTVLCWQICKGRSQGSRTVGGHEQGRQGEVKREHAPQCRRSLPGLA